jgi:CheY-like chemotaxis protein
MGWPPTPTTPTRRPGCAFWWVEDHADTATTQAALLRKVGYEVCVARDGPTALQLATASLPDVVLLDLGLPELDGCEVARRLRELPGPKRPFIIAITGYSRPEDRLRSGEAGVDLYFVKPVDPKELLALMQRLEGIVLPVSEGQSAHGTAVNRSAHANDSRASCSSP